MWDGTGVVELAAGRWGAARMYGSPIVHEDGYITEGRPVAQPARPRLPTPGSSSSSGSSSALDRFGAGHLYADPVDGPNFDLNSSSAVPAAPSSSSSAVASSASASSASASASASASSASTIASASQSSESASASVAP